MDRRTYLAVLAGGASLGGCVGSTSPSTPTPSVDSLVGSGDGDYPHELRVDDSLERDVTLTITVTRDGTRLYRGTHTVAAGTTAVVAGFTRESLPPDRRAVTVTATDDAGHSTAVDVSVSDCLGDVVISYGSDGSLQSTYAIC